MIGILAVQGNYAAHAQMLTRLDAKHTFVVAPSQLKNCQGLIIPGGESSTMLKFITANGLFDAIIKFNQQHKPIFGTCAGAILLSKQTINPEQQSLGLIDITIKRNGYGRQLQSHIATGKNLLHNNPQEMVFIRAPQIVTTGKNVTILAKYNDENVCVTENNCIAATFHPELTADSFWHNYFLQTTNNENKRLAAI